MPDHMTCIEYAVWIIFSILVELGACNEKKLHIIIQTSKFRLKFSHSKAEQELWVQCGVRANLNLSNLR